MPPSSTEVIDLLSDSDDEQPALGGGAPAHQARRADDANGGDGSEPALKRVRPSNEHSDAAAVPAGPPPARAAELAMSAAERLSSRMHAPSARPTHSPSTLMPETQRALAAAFGGPADGAGGSTAQGASSTHVLRLATGQRVADASTFRALAGLQPPPPQQQQQQQQQQEQEQDEGGGQARQQLQQHTTYVPPVMAQNTYPGVGVTLTGRPLQVKNGGQPPVLAAAPKGATSGLQAPVPTPETAMERPVTTHGQQLAHQLSEMHRWRQQNAPHLPHLKPPLPATAIMTPQEHVQQTQLNRARQYQQQQQQEQQQPLYMTPDQRDRQEGLYVSRQPATKDIAGKFMPQVVTGSTGGCGSGRHISPEPPLQPLEPKRFGAALQAAAGAGGNPVSMDATLRALGAAGTSYGAGVPNPAVDASIARIQDDLQKLTDVEGQECLPPDGSMTVELLRHQRIALSWMRHRETSGLPHGGILADDQGLGKTVSTLALILTERSSQRKSKAIEEMRAQMKKQDDAHKQEQAGGRRREPKDGGPAAANGHSSAGEGPAGAGHSAGGRAANDADVIELLDTDDEEDSQAHDEQKHEATACTQPAATEGVNTKQQPDEAVQSLDDQQYLREHTRSTADMCANDSKRAAHPSSSPDGMPPAASKAVTKDPAQPSDKADNGEMIGTPPRAESQGDGDAEGAFDDDILCGGPDDEHFLDDSDDDCVLLEDSDDDVAVIGSDGSDDDLIIVGDNDWGRNAASARAVTSDNEDSDEADAIERAERTLPKKLRTTNFAGGSRHKGGTLIVCPTCVLHQWAREIVSKTSKEADVRVLMYHGAKREASAAQLARADVVLTTYGTLTVDCNKGKIRATPRKGKGKEAAGGTVDEPRWLATLAGPLYGINWHRVVLDEAQTVKNHRTGGAHAVTRLKAQRRWCLSGTPMQNHVRDLLSYFRFLRYDPFNTPAGFAANISDAIRTNEARGLRRLQQILKLVMLRRTKGSKLEGKPIIDLPEREVTRITPFLSGRQGVFYKQLELRSKEEFQALDQAGKVQAKYISVLTMLLRLRQAANHPHLVRGWEALLQVVDRLMKSDNAADTANLKSAIQRLAHDVLNTKPKDAAAAAAGSGVVDRGGGDDALTEIEEGEGEDAGGQHDVKDEDTSIQVPLKVCELLKLLARLHEESRETGHHEQAVVFSQWTAMLDLIEPHLVSKGFSFRRVDGRMTVPRREAALAEFRDPSNRVDVMLMSLKAASLGINLTCARNVMLMDMWWNPTTEDQAIDRCHRIGQTRKVRVTRFAIGGTVEERILKLQDHKRTMVASAFGEEQDGSNVTTSGSRLGVEELRFLFR